MGPTVVYFEPVLVLWSPSPRTSGAVRSAADRSCSLSTRERVLQAVNAGNGGWQEAQALRAELYKVAKSWPLQSKAQWLLAVASRGALCSLVSEQTRRTAGRHTNRGHSECLLVGLGYQGAGCTC